MIAENENLHHTDDHAMGPDEIVILDFGSQYSHLIARRLRSLNVFCELFAGTATADELLHQQPSNHAENAQKSEKEGPARRIKGVILSGGPASVYEEDAPHVHASVWALVKERRLPVLGICYGMQEIAHVFGGEVSPSEEREFGKSTLSLPLGEESESVREKERETLRALLFQDVSQWQMWMSHGDKVTRLPRNFLSLAESENSPHAAIGEIENLFFGLQFHPEVTHSLQGTQILKNFALSICKVRATWNMRALSEELIEKVRAQVGETAHVIGAVSGGVDSSVAAILLHRAIGERFHAVLVDNGLLRANEAQRVSERLRDRLGLNLTVIDASDKFLAALKGVTEPEKKRRVIGGLFIEVFQEQAEIVQERLKKESSEGEVRFLLQGTLYPDVIESQSHRGPSATIKTHHNVGGLPATMKLQLVEPLRLLFKDEVRELGEALGIEHESLYRHPFPGPGLGIRVLGEITPQRAETLRKADSILIQELNQAGVYNDIAQAAAVLLPVKSVGVMGDRRTYEEVCAIRCVTSSDFMTADWYQMDYALLGKISTRIINEVSGINRVCYDVSSKPPATIEWE